MITNQDPVFDAALALPLQQRANLAAKLIESLEAAEMVAPLPQNWREEIEAASDELHRGEADLVAGEEALAMIQTAIDRASTGK